MNLALNNEFLTVYLSLFNAILEKSELKGNKIYGTVSFIEDPDYLKDQDEDETQDISWELKENDYCMSQNIHLLKHIKENNFNDNDKILLSEIELVKILENLGIDSLQTQEVLNFLFDCEVPMIDEGIESDSFFFHLQV